MEKGDHMNETKLSGIIRRFDDLGRIVVPHIQDYFHEKKMSKMPGFLGFGARYSDAVPVKTAPA